MPMRARSNARRRARARRPSRRDSRDARSNARRATDRYFASALLRVRARRVATNPSHVARNIHTDANAIPPRGGAARLATTRDGRARARRARGSLDTRFRDVDNAARRETWRRRDGESDERTWTRTRGGGSKGKDADAPRTFVFTRGRMADAVKDLSEDLRKVRARRGEARRGDAIEGRSGTRCAASEEERAD